MYTVNLFSPFIGIFFIEGKLQVYLYLLCSPCAVVEWETWSQSVQMRIKPRVWKAMSNWRNGFEEESLLLAFLTRSSKLPGVLGTHQLQREFSVQYFLAELGVQKWGPDDNELIGWQTLMKGNAIREKAFLWQLVCHGLCSDKKWHKMAVWDCKI